MKKISWLAACSALTFSASASASAVPPAPELALDHSVAVQAVRNALLQDAQGSVLEPAQQRVQLAQWPNWGNWSNWNNWQNWANWGNWGNY